MLKEGRMTKATHKRFTHILPNLQTVIMKYEVKLYVGGKVFTEEVQAVNNQDAKGLLHWHEILQQK